MRRIRPWTDLHGWLSVSSWIYLRQTLASVVCTNSGSAKLSFEPFMYANCGYTQPFLDNTTRWYPGRTWIPLAKVTGSLHLWLPQYSLNLNTFWRNFDHRYRCDFDSNFDSAILRPQSRTPTTSTLNDNWYHSLSLWLRPVSWLTVIMESRLRKNPWNISVIMWPKQKGWDSLFWKNHF